VPVYKNLPPNITHLFQQAVDRFGDRTFLVLNDRRLTFGETIGQAAALAEILKRDYGLVPGDRVAVAMRNTPDWVVAFFATLIAGGCGALINSRGAPDEMLHAVHHTDCRIVIADRRRADAIAPGFKGALLVSDDQGAFTDRAAGRVLELQPTELKVTDAKPDDPCLILFTSGTTGRPKGAVLDHRGCYSGMFTLSLNQASAMAWNAKKLGVPVEKLMAAAAGSQASFFGIFPFFHTSGSQAMLLGSLSNGGKLVMLDRWDPDAALNVILKERISSVILPPSALWDLVGHPELAHHDLSFVTTVGTGGQATPPNLHAAYLAAFKNSTAGSAYGQSETNGGITGARGDEYKEGCAGRVFPFVRMKIVDDDGAELPTGEIGEVCVKSVLNMVGYWNQEDATKAAFLPEGWLRTGDIGRLDSENYVTIVDRKKDMIIRGGENLLRGAGARLP
jgi:acyl-CoA synthetase (AMP-forming)/AMP-acid ligase II